MATKAATKKRKKNVVVESDPPIVITGGGGSGGIIVGSGVAIEITDDKGKKVRIVPKHNSSKITHMTLTVDYVKEGIPLEDQYLFDSQTEYKVSIRFFTDANVKGNTGSTSGSKKGSKKSARR